MKEDIMAQLNIRKLTGSSPRTPGNQISPTFEQLLREEAQCSKRWSPRALGLANRDQEENMCASPSNKSVLSKVKERAKKLKSSLSIKKKQIVEPNDGNCSCSTPPQVVNLDEIEDDDDDEEFDEELDEDPEYLGAPMYESEAAPESLRETARQHPRAEPVLSESHNVPNMARKAQEEKLEETNKSMAMAVSEKLGPAYAAVSDATHKITSKIVSFTVAAEESGEAESRPNQTQNEAQEEEEEEAKAGSDAEQIHASQDDESDEEITRELEEPSQLSTTRPQAVDKGVSIKEYFRIKLEPGEDERALSQAISEAISPRKGGGGDAGVVGKMKGAVTSLFKQEGQQNTGPKKLSLLSSFGNTSSKTQNAAQQKKQSVGSAKAHPAKAFWPNRTNSAPHITLSSRAKSPQVLEEENHQGRILQPN